MNDDSKLQLSRVLTLKHNLIEFLNKAKSGLAAVKGTISGMGPDSNDELTERVVDVERAIKLFETVGTTVVEQMIDDLEQESGVRTESVAVYSNGKRTVDKNSVASSYYHLLDELNAQPTLEDMSADLQVPVSAVRQLLPDYLDVNEETQEIFEL